MRVGRGTESVLSSSFSVEEDMHLFVKNKISKSAKNPENITIFLFLSIIRGQN
jgi:hypothetical protein